MTVFKDFVQKVFVEEMTGTGCGWCPRGIVGMQLMKQKYGDRFVGVAIHRYNASTDPMAPREYLTLDDLPAGNAPLCIINRNGNQAVDPYFGSSGEKFGISRDIEKELYYGTAEVGVTVSGVWNADQTEVTATAVVEANIAGDFDVAFILVADSVVGDNAACIRTTTMRSMIPPTVAMLPIPTSHSSARVVPTEPARSSSILSRMW